MSATLSLTRELMSCRSITPDDAGCQDLVAERRAVDAVFRELECVFLPGYSRPLIRAIDYLALIERSTYRRDRVRPGSGVTTRHDAYSFNRS